jgi:hypothetical protein
VPPHPPVLPVRPAQCTARRDFNRALVLDRTHGRQLTRARGSAKIK